ncbi:MAG: MBL fold metallo-hydrolase, partial [Clostridiales Family XIII bacterium]|nr:MBL fold metallo-hydrolase [Clostridiales Family XIII bacterium]
MRISFCGAAESVTGSCHLIEADSGGAKASFLLDCGQFQGSSKQNAQNFEPFPFKPEQVDFLILSHAHIDHCGRIPLLVKRGFRGRVYCTAATADLLPIMLRDSAYIHEKEAEWQNKKGARSGKAPVEPLFTMADAEASLATITPVLYDQEAVPAEGVRFSFVDAGHILGSAIAEIWVREGGGETKIVFSGDLGVETKPLLRDPVKVRKADIVIMESTYGNRLHEKGGASIERLAAIIEKTTKRGGVVLIPSFAVGRTQELIYELNKFYESKDDAFVPFKNIKVYIDSPMASAATEVFRKNIQDFDADYKALVMAGDDPLDFANLVFTHSTDESKALNEEAGPKVIISASGMCEAGRIRHHLKHRLWDRNSSVVFVGYQAEGTLGRRIIEGAKTVSLFGEEI